MSGPRGRLSEKAAARVALAAMLLAVFLVGLVAGGIIFSECP